MKFLCDRCKTRYAIADDRVRGKILKIRCKNCSAVITVREGMDDGSAEPARNPAPTMPAPLAAPAAPPPAALDDEWYVSKDGNQEGPFTLTEAQAWITARAQDDELFCWNEGFDDWLPVEKVSHFRGLRGAPRGRAQTRPGIPVEPEPQPLFAATLAAMEAEVAAAAPEPPPHVPTSAAEAISQLPPPKEASVPAWKVPEPVAPPPRAATPARGLPATPRAATPAVGVPALPRLGTPAAGVPTLPKLGTPATGVPAVPRAAAQPAPQPAPQPPPSAPTPTPAAPAAKHGLPTPFGAPPRPATAPAAALAAPLPAAAPVAPPLAAAPVLAPAAPPVAAPPPAAADARFDHGEPPDADPDLLDDDDGPAAPPAPAAAPHDDDLDIGEVSRVVRLADLMGPPAAAAPAAARPAVVRQPTQSMPVLGRATGAAPALGRSTAAVPVMTGVPMADAPPPFEPALAPPPARRRHAGLYIGIGALAVGLIVVAAVVLSGSGEDADGNATSGGNDDFSNLGYRPNDPMRPSGGTGGGVEVGPGTGKGPGTGRHPVNTNGTGGGTGPRPATVDAGVSVPSNPGLRDLTPDDVFTMSARMETGTRRCYERAMKADPFLKVSKIRATINVSAAGPVTSVTLSDKADHPLGQCLIAAIKRWPFPPSKDGIVSEFALVFEQK